MRTRKLSLFGTGLVAVVMLGACGSSDEGSTSLNDQQAALIGEAAATQIGAIAGSLGNFQFSGSGAPRASLPPASRADGCWPSPAAAAGPRAAARLLLLDPPEGCIPIAVGDSADTDGDGIPNGVTYVFNASNCTVLDTVTGITTTVTGSAGFTDTDDADTFFGYNADFGAWTISQTDGVNTQSFRLNGTSDADIGTGNVVGSDHYSVRLNFGPTDNITVTQNWDAGFTPAQGQVVDPQAASLPPGTFGVNGNFGFRGVSGQQSGDWSFALSTTTALAFDPACSDPNQIVGGSVRGAISGHTTVGFTVDYGLCGEAPVVAVFGNAP